MDDIARNHVTQASDVATRVIDIVTKQLEDTPTGRLSLATTFDELEVDSFDIIEITFSLEEEFDIDISNEDARDIKSIGDFVDRLNTLLQAKALGANSAKGS